MFYRQQTSIVCAECGTEALAWQLFDGGVRGRALAPELPTGWHTGAARPVCGAHTAEAVDGVTATPGWPFVSPAASLASSLGWPGKAHGGFLISSPC